MEYLGEFLSTTNKITRDSDTVTKYFYYRPDKYDNPNADLENIFALRALSGFPQIGDQLSENNNYYINDIDIAKRIDDTQKGVKKVSYVVTCTYEVGGVFFGSGKKKEKKNNVEKDKDGRLVTEKTPPWKLKNTYTRQPVQVEVPFIKGYDANNVKNEDVVNSAGKRLLASTSRYRFEYTVKINTRFPDMELDQISGCYLNEGYWDPDETEGLGPFDAKTCLMFPVTYSQNTWQEPASGLVAGQVHDYREYTVKFIYDPQGWDKVLLNIGTWAKFYSDQPAEQIFSYRTKDGNSWSALHYGNLAKIEEKRSLFSASGVVYEKVTEPLPLTSAGFVYELAITDVEHHPYLTKSFQEFPTYNFDLFVNI